MCFIALCHLNARNFLESQNLKLLHFYFAGEVRSGLLFIIELIFIKNVKYICYLKFLLDIPVLEF